MACGPRVAVDGGVRIVGAAQASGLDKPAFVDITLGLRDANGAVLPDPKTGQALRRVRRLRGTTDWTALSDTVEASGATEARVCVRVRGTTGRALVRDLRVERLSVQGGT